MWGVHILQAYDNYVILNTSIYKHRSRINVKMTLQSRCGISVDGNCIDEKLEFNVFYSKEYIVLINLLEGTGNRDVIMLRLIRECDDELFKKYVNKLYKLKGWVIIKSLTKVLSLHKRAVERVNHPDCLLEQGVFEIEI